MKAIASFFLFPACTDIGWMASWLDIRYRRVQKENVQYICIYYTSALIRFFSTYSISSLYVRYAIVTSMHSCVGIYVFVILFENTKQCQKSRGKEMPFLPRQTWRAFITSKIPLDRKQKLDPSLKVLVFIYILDVLIRSSLLKFPMQFDGGLRDASTWIMFARLSQFKTNVFYTG